MSRQFSCSCHDNIRWGGGKKKKKNNATLPSTTSTTTKKSGNDFGPLTAENLQLWWHQTRTINEKEHLDAGETFPFHPCKKHEKLQRLDTERTSPDGNCCPAYNPTWSCVTASHVQSLPITRHDGSNRAAVNPPCCFRARTFINT